MTTLVKEFQWNSVLAHKGTEPWINSYEARVVMRVLTGEHEEYNTAYGRMRYWFYDIMHDAVLIEHDDDRIASWRGTGMRCIEFPVGPVDQVIGLMLMSKLAAMTEHRVEIAQVAISSPADEFVQYFCDTDDSLHWFEQPGWWRDLGPNHVMETRPDHTGSKVIAISRGQSWKDQSLDWSTAANDLRGNVSILPNRDRDA